MHEQVDLVNITFSENSDVDVTQLNALYRLIGWDRSNRRTAAETAEMLKVHSCPSMRTVCLSR
jgi:hypothetical protein